MSAFKNAPNTDFSVAANRERVKQALAKGLPTFDSGGTGEKFSTVNPAQPTQIIGYCPRHSYVDVNEAVSKAKKLFPKWRGTPVETRCKVLEILADLIEKHRLALTTLMVMETGKPVIESDADISEAVDFCRYYAHIMRGLGVEQRTQTVAGEDCFQCWTPRGVAAVIAPWNFPLAILCGMTTAALVTGNTVILKPAEQSSVLGLRFFELLEQAIQSAGAPEGVAQIICGFGDEVGAPLTMHRDVDIVAFTGSREVGCKIFKAAGVTSIGQENLKKVVCEMGGKNAMIIDSSADLDEAVLGAIRSAFGYAGQKCSALSRLIVLADCHDRFVERLVAAAANWKVGDPLDMSVDMGPLIEPGSVERCKLYRLIGIADAKLVYEGTAPKSFGYFFPPTIFKDVPRTSKLFREEIFGPILAITKAVNFDEALSLANDSDYALTGGVYSRSPENLLRARQEFLVGNLYLNRPITGAIVERHPFGGFKMSGGGTKAGGPEYLQHFMFPRAIAENTLRRGFAPNTEN